MNSSVATKKRQNVNQLTIGIDLGDRWGHYCILDEHGEVLEEGRVPMTRKALTAHFSGVPARIAMEAGAYSAWISEHLSAMGHEVIVANARELRAISGSNNKNDRAGAEKLARFARVDPKILRPIQHRFACRTTASHRHPRTSRSGPRPFSGCQRGARFGQTLRLPADAMFHGGVSIAPSRLLAR